jgi:hypothetical protein
MERGHVDGRCSFESIIRKNELKDPALLQLAKIIHAADVLTRMDEVWKPLPPGLVCASRTTSKTRQSSLRCMTPCMPGANWTSAKPGS